MELNDTIQIPFPDDKAWAGLYTKFHTALVNSLGGRFCLADREDAVQEAFDKLMHRKDREAYGNKVPKTEKDWFCNIRWQAKAFLSHMKDHRDVHARYVVKAAAEMADSFADGLQGIMLDAELMNRALVRALEMFRADQDISRRNLSVYLMRMSGVPSKEVAKKFGITANNVDRIKFNVGHLLEKHGRECFERALAEEASRDCGCCAA